VPTAILGAGAAGLSLAVLLRERGESVTVFERERTPGGLCRSRCIMDFTFDQGPHVLGGIPEAVEWIRVSTGLTWETGRTRNRAWINGAFAQHPFEDPAQVTRYSRKLWKRDPSSLSRVRLGAQAGRKPGGVSEYAYPSQGGYGAITEAWARRVDTALICGASDPDLSGFDRVVSTIPVAQLPYNSLITVSAGFTGIDPDFTALYIPGDETVFHRVSVPSNFASANAPIGLYSLQAEATCPGELAFSPDAYCQSALELFERLGHRDPLLLDAHVSPHAYPLPLDVDLEPSWQIRHGRTGSHKYLNLDGVVAASMELADQLLA